MGPGFQHWNNQLKIFEVTNNLHKAYLHRKYLPDATYGELTVGDLTVFTIELPWKDNQKGISCIPEGICPVFNHTSPNLGECMWVKHVPDRSEILIHAANFVSELRGCIAPGMKQADINRDGIIDNVRSKKALQKLLRFDISEIEIRS